MADQTDVADALVGIIAAAVYPNGTSQPPAGGVQAKIYQGWPNPAQLKADLAAQIAHISVWPTPKATMTTRHAIEWKQVVAPAPTLAAAVAGTAITLSGTVTVPQAVALIVDGKDYAYGVQAGDTLASIATALAALIAANQTASAAGPVITVPGSHKLVARIVANGTSAAEVARENRVFMVTIWADCFDNREPLAKVVIPALAALTRLTLPDGTGATCDYQGSVQVDSEQKQGIFRRDISIAVDFATIQTRTDNQVGIVQTRPYIVTGATAVAQPIFNQ